MARDNGNHTGQVAEPAVSFRDRLAAAIEGAPIGRDEIARQIGRSEAAISQWLNKGDVPDLAIVFKLENALDLRLGALVQHHSPDVWVIIETKVAGGNTWQALTWERKLREALMDGPFDNMERKIVRDTAERFARYHLTAGNEPEPTS